MSQIKLKHSGGNGVIIAAPSSNPASDRTITLPSDADGTLARTLDVSFKSYAIIADVKSGGNNGGTFTSGAWRTRDLNTEIADDDGIVSISSNQFTLQAGTYKINAYAPAHRVDRHQAALYNVTDASFVQKGINAYDDGSGITNANVIAKFTITGAKVFEIQHRCQTTENDEGFGIKIQTGNSAGFDTTEVFCVVEIFKEA